MARYCFDVVSLRGLRLSRRLIECLGDTEAVNSAVALFGGFVAAHLEVWEADRLVWSSRGPWTASGPGDRAPLFGHAQETWATLLWAWLRLRRTHVKSRL
jgi:hypothetical protein